jgi:hypothetical protein
LRASESRGDRQGAPVEGEAEGLEDGKASPSGGLQHGPDIGIKRGPPRRAEAVGDLAEDNAGPERLLGAVVGGRDGAVGDEDEEVLAEALDDALELQPGLGGRDDPEEIVEPGLETASVASASSGRRRPMRMARFKSAFRSGASASSPLSMAY